MLIKCPECGKEISDKSDICVNCGYPIKNFIEEQAQKEEQREKEFYFDESNNVYVYCGRNYFIEIKDGYMTVSLPRQKEVKDFLFNFSLEYFSMPKLCDATICIYNVKKGYDSGIVRVALHIGQKKGNFETFHQFKDIMKKNGLFRDRKKSDIRRGKSEDDQLVQENFQGIYREGTHSQVCCPECGSINCSHHYEEKFIPGKTKTSYSANLNPLKPFTFVNKKEKVIRKDSTVKISNYICNDCGKIFY